MRVRTFLSTFLVRAGRLLADHGRSLLLFRQAVQTVQYEWFMIMEYCSLGTLWHAMRGGAFHHPPTVPESFAVAAGSRGGAAGAGAAGVIGSSVNRDVSGSGQFKAESMGSFRQFQAQGSDSPVGRVPVPKQFSRSVHCIAPFRAPQGFLMSLFCGFRSTAESYAALTEGMLEWDAEAVLLVRLVGGCTGGRRSCACKAAYIVVVEPRMLLSSLV